MIKNIINRLKNWTSTDVNSIFSSAELLQNKTIDLSTFFTSWTFACVNKRSNAFASIENYVYKKLADGSFEVINKHWINDLLDKPNHLNNITWFDLKQLISKSLDFSGNAYLYMEKNGASKPVNIWFIPSNDIRPVIAQNQIIHYEQLSTSRIYDKSDIIHFKTLSMFKF
jgi:phage portal protein BeeE